VRREQLCGFFNNHPLSFPLTTRIDMADKNLFTANEVWTGGHYELFIQPSVDSSEELRSLLKALWTFPCLEGCYLVTIVSQPFRHGCSPAKMVSRGTCMV
jgi:hypothetical protein